MDPVFWEYIVKVGSPAIVLLCIAVWWLQKQLRLSLEENKRLNGELVKQANEHLKRILDAARILEEAVRFVREK